MKKSILVKSVLGTVIAIGAITALGYTGNTYKAVSHSETLSHRSVKEDPVTPDVNVTTRGVSELMYGGPGLFTFWTEVMVDEAVAAGMLYTQINENSSYTQMTTPILDGFGFSYDINGTTHTAMFDGAYHDDAKADSTEYSVYAKDIDQTQAGETPFITVDAISAMSGTSFKIAVTVHDRDIQGSNKIGGENGLNLHPVETVFSYDNNSAGATDESNIGTVQFKSDVNDQGFQLSDKTGDGFAVTKYADTPVWYEVYAFDNEGAMTPGRDTFSNDIVPGYITATLYSAVDGSTVISNEQETSFDVSFEIEKPLADVINGGNSESVMLTYEDEAGDQRSLEYSVLEPQIGTGGVGTKLNFKVTGYYEKGSSAPKDLRPNTTINNVRAYYQPTYTTSNGVISTLDVPVSGAGGATEFTVSTLALEPTVNRIKLPVVGEQTTANFNITYNTEAITGKAEVTGHSDYASLKESDIKVSLSKVGGYKTDPVVTVDSYVGNESTVTASYTATDLAPASKYNILVSLKGGTAQQIGTINTAGYTPAEFAEITPGESTYHSAPVVIQFNQGGIEYEDIVPGRVKAYRESVTKSNELTLSYDAASSDPTTETHSYTIENLNTDNIDEGETLNVVFTYEEKDGNVITSDKVELSTKPLEPVTLDGTTGLAEITQTSATIDTVNFSVDNLVSEGTYSGTDENPYQTLQYGENFKIKYSDDGESTWTELEEITDLNQQGIIVVSEEGNSFILSIPETKAAIGASSTEISIQIGILDEKGAWDWKEADEKLNLEDKKQAELVDGISVVLESVTQNEVSITYKVRHSKDGSGEYEAFDPSTDIKFKGYNEEKPKGDVLGINENKLINTVEEDADTVVSEYQADLYGLRAGVEYTSMGASIKGGTYKTTPNIFTTEARDAAQVTKGSVKEGDKTYNSVSLDFAATTGGNFEELVGSNKGDYVVELNGEVTTDYKIVKNSTKAIDGPGTYEAEYNHVDYEKEADYRITFNNLFEENVSQIEVTEVTIYLADQPSEKQTWTGSVSTVERKPVQFAEGSWIEVITEEGSDDALNSFEFLFSMYYGDTYMDWDPTISPTEDNPGISLFAKVNGKSNYEELDIEFVQIESESDNRHVLQYRATNLRYDSTYSDLMLTIGSDNPDDAALVEGENKLTSDAVFHTNGLMVPILTSSFTANQTDVQNESFTFSIQAVEGSTSPTITNSGYDIFRPEVAYLAHKTEGVITEEMDTTYLGKSGVSRINNVNYETHSFEVTGLTPGYTYKNLYFSYDGGRTNEIALPGKSVTMSEFEDPFDAANNPIIFDYQSVTSNSFEFKIDIKSNDSSISGYAPNETIMFANSRQLKTTEIVEKREVIGEVDADASKDEDGYVLTRYTYEVTGLYENTSYTDMVIFINAYEGNKVTESSKSKNDKTYETRIHEIPYVTIKTNPNYRAIKISVILMLLLIIWIILIIILYILYRMWTRFVSMGVYADKRTMELGLPILNLVNAGKHKEFWNTPADKMRFYTMGVEQQSQFIKKLDEYGNPTGAYDVVLPQAYKEPKMIATLMAALKYDAFEVSWDDGATRHPVQNIKNTKAMKLDKFYGTALGRMLKKSQKRKQLENSAEEINAGTGQEPIILFNKDRATATTVRYEATIPMGHQLWDSKELYKPHMCFYYQVDNRLYPMKTTFLKEEGRTLVWEMSDLQPGTVYTGLHWSVDGGKTLYGSSTLFAKTRRSNGKKVTYKDAALPEAAKGKRGLHLPTLEKTVGYIGKSMTNRLLSISAQKHIQRDTGIWFHYYELEDGKLEEYLHKWYKDTEALTRENTLETQLGGKPKQEKLVSATDIVKESLGGEL